MPSQNNPQQIPVLYVFYRTNQATYLNEIIHVAEGVSSDDAGYRKLYESVAKTHSYSFSCISFAIPFNPLSLTRYQGGNA